MLTLANGNSLISVVEDFVLVTTFMYTCGFYWQIDRDETEKENDHDSVFGVRLHLFEPLAEAGGAAGEEERQIHPCKVADVSQR